MLEEIDEGQSYANNKTSSEAVRTIISMQKASGKKLPQMSIHISQRGITVTNTETDMVFTELDIYRVHFCCADSAQSKVFAYIARSTENETMECHAFLCPKAKIAEAITLTVAHAFSLAKEEEDDQDILQRALREQALSDSSCPSSPSGSDRGSPFLETPCDQRSITSSPSLSSHSSSSDFMGFEDDFASMFISKPPK